MRSLLLACAALIATADAWAQQPAPIPETSNQLGYASPAQALAALRARPDVVFSQQRGWLVAEDRADHAVWNFVPQGHPAFPAVVRRRLVVQGSTVLLDMRVLCGATKPVCDALVREFQQMNEAVRHKLG